MKSRTFSKSPGRIARWGMAATGVAILALPQTVFASPNRTVEIKTDSNWHWAETTLSEAFGSAQSSNCHAWGISVNVRVRYRVSSGNFQVDRVTLKNNGTSDVAVKSTAHNGNIQTSSIANANTSPYAAGTTRAVLDARGQNIFWTESFNGDELLGIKVVDVGPTSQNPFGVCVMGGVIRFNDSDGK